jgi:hypothetical protein
VIEAPNGWYITDYGAGEYDRMGPLLCWVQTGVVADGGGG